MMYGRQKLLFGEIGGLILLVLAAAIATKAQSIQVDTIPTGLRPLGVDIEVLGAVGSGQYVAVVANSGEDSLSLFGLNFDASNPANPKSIVPSSSVKGVPAPYAIGACLGMRAIVTSPSDNSVSILQLPQGTVLARLQVGSHPNAVACFAEGNSVMAAVSNVGDNTLTIVDLTGLSIVATVPNVAGARGLHGMLVHRNQVGSNIAWVGGTDVGVVTLVDLGTANVLTRLSVPSPIVVGPSGSPNEVYVVSSSANDITFFNAETLQINGTSLPDIPNAQDYVNSGLGSFFTIGGQDAIGWSGGVIPNVPGAAGLAAVSLTPKALPTTSVVLATSTNSNSLLFIQLAPRTPSQFTVSNGASFGTTQATAGQLASLFASTGVSQNFYAGTIPLLKILGGVSMKIGGTLTFNATTGNWDYSASSPIPGGGAQDVPLVFVGPNQVNFQIPPGTPPGNAVPVQLTKADGTTLLSTVNITATAPGIFSVLMNGQGQGAVLNQDNSQTESRN